MPDKFIPGTLSLQETEAAILYEELSFRVATGSKEDTNGGKRGNRVAFQPVNNYPGALKLTAASASPPPEFTKAWAAQMLVAGASRPITAWRQAPSGTAKSAGGKAKAGPAQKSRASPETLSEARSLPALQTHADRSRFSVLNGTLIGPSGAPVKQLSSPNQGNGIDPKYLIVHYTAGTTLEGTVSWFLNKAAQASAHLVIARDGSIVQMVSLGRRAWHAGKSKWKSLSGLNAYAVGIELVNAGKLRKAPQGWVNWADRKIPDDEVTLAVHKHEQMVTGWHEYTEAQIAALLDVAVALHHEFRFEDVLGHDDVSPGRKPDPGPLFPMDSIRSRLFGRR
jgi:N-acetylmuramoyl-L-alanine amidase